MRDGNAQYVVDVRPVWGDRPLHNESALPQGMIARNGTDRVEGSISLFRRDGLRMGEESIEDC